MLHAWIRCALACHSLINSCPSLINSCPLSHVHPRFAPIGICFLLGERIVRMEDPIEEFTGLAVYMGTVTAGLAIHAFIVLPLIYVIVVRRNPFKFAFHMLEAIILALGTASR